MKIMRMTFELSYEYDPAMYDFLSDEEATNLELKLAQEDSQEYVMNALWRWRNSCNIRIKAISAQIIEEK